jgi:succinoglycan biosynthesis protein ExoM
MRCDRQATSLDFPIEHAVRDGHAAFVQDGVAAPDPAALLLPGAPAQERAAARILRAAVGVCTARRPRMLARCLETIGAQDPAAGAEVHVVVADNEPEPANRPAVHAFAARCRFPVHYTHEPRPGIPQARNAVLARCRELNVDWIAFTDDDCRVSPTWLASLLAAARRHRADVVYGRHELVLPRPTPFWTPYPAGHGYTEGQSLRSAATHNVLFAAWLVGERGLRGDRCCGSGAIAFDERLTCGEDTDFFHRAVLRGARIVYAREPVVFETVTARRATLRYQTSRAYHAAASRSRFHRRHRGLAVALRRLAARWLLQAPVALARLLAAPLVWPFSASAFKALVVKGTARLAGAAGAAAGLLGLGGNPYREIDGY